EHPPVELEHLYLAGERDSDRTDLLPTFVDGAPNRQAARLDHSQGKDPSGRRRRRIHTPRRAKVARILDDNAMLPAVYFIFSRKGCDEAVRQCVNAGLRLTNATERAAIRAVADAHPTGLS